MSVARRAFLPPPAPTRRRDIQGLRTVAVLAVIAYHVLGKPVGGFLGVDVFFVVSGFVITGVLLRRVDATAGVDLGVFYLRRARRILPLGLLVIAATLLAARLTWGPPKSDAVALDGLWAALFMANWRFAAQASNYFDLGGLPSPLTHYWSLSVEEQFYLLWPGLLALAWWLLRRRVTVRFTVLGVAVPIAVAGLVLGAWQFETDPIATYYSSLTRTWELALGCILAALPAPPLRPAARTGLSWIGLAGILAAFAWTSQSIGVPVPGAFGVCAATALVLLAGTGDEPRGAWMLANPASVYLGDISYGLYLWHLPIVVIGSAWLDRGTPTYIAIVSGLSLALATITHYLVEKPVLEGRFSPRPMLAAAVALALLAVSAVGANALAPGWWDGAGTATAPLVVPSDLTAEPTASETPTPTPTITTASPTPTATPTPTVVPLGATGEALQKGLRGGLALTSWPADLSPAKPEGGGNPASGIKACEATKVSSATSCTFGTTDGPELVIYGDSLGINLLAAVEAAYGETYRIRGLTKLACAVNGADVDFGQPDWATPCVNHRRAVIEYVNRTRPKVLFMVETYNWSLSLNSGATGAARAAEWAAADQAFVDAVTPSGTQVVIVSPSVDGVAYYDCYRQGGSPQRCTAGVPSWWRPIQDAERTVRGAVFLDTLHWYCVDGRCPMISTASGHTLMKVDYIHVTYAYDTLVAADLRWRVTALGVSI